MTVSDALLQQKRELELRRQESYIERTTEIRNGNSRLIRIVIDPRLRRHETIPDRITRYTFSKHY